MAQAIFKVRAIAGSSPTGETVYITMLQGGFPTEEREENFTLTVDWGDGTVQTEPDIDEWHIVPKPGIYTITETWSGGVCHMGKTYDFLPAVIEAELDESTVIESDAFYHWNALTKLTLGATVPPILGEDAFSGTDNLTAIYVPLSAVNAYKTAEGWSSFANIIRGYIPMKTVTAGAHYTNVTVDEAETVKFSFASTSLSVEAVSGDITVALSAGAQEGDDETITVPAGESRMFIHHRPGVDTYYLTGTGEANLYASNVGDVNPFKAKAKGGDGGGGTLGIEEVVLWEKADPSVRPTQGSLITVSDNLSNYDEVFFIWAYNSSGSYAYNWDASVGMFASRTGGLPAQLASLEEGTKSFYNVSANGETLTLARLNATYVVKIIGRRYTRVNPTGYRETVLWENSGTTNPDTITLSQAYTNFDDVVIVATDGAYMHCTASKVSVLSLNNKIGCCNDSKFVWYTLTTSTTLTLFNAYGLVVSKIIGIKY